MVYDPLYSAETLDDQVQLPVREPRLHSEWLDRGKNKDRQMMRNQNQATK